MAAAGDVNELNPLPELGKVASIHTGWFQLPLRDLGLFNMGLRDKEYHKSSEASGNLWFSERG